MPVFYIFWYLDFPIKIYLANLIYLAKIPVQNGGADLD